MTTTRTDPASRYLWLVAAFVLIAAIEGCYTLVRHPGIPQLNYQRPPSDSPCASCHSPEQHLAFVTPQRFDPARGVWGKLSHPWWFEKPDSVRSDGAQSD